MSRWLKGVLLLLGIATLAGCAVSPMPTPTHAPTATPGPVTFVQASSELVVGTNRFAFALLGPDNAFVAGAQARVVFGRVSEGKVTFTLEGYSQYRSVEIPAPHTHEGGQVHVHTEVRGIYVVDGAEFNAPGTWAAHVEVVLADGSGPFPLNVSFLVSERGATPAIGAPAPPTRNTTGKDVKDLSEISSSNPPILAFYRVSIAEALERHKPFVVVFATPAFCVSRLCGPIVEIVAQLLPAYGDRVEFIHVEPYELGVLRKEGRFQLVEAAKEWGLPAEPYVFVVNAQGRVTAKFEGIFTVEELKASLDRALGS